MPPAPRNGESNARRSDSYKFDIDQGRSRLNIGAIGNVECGATVVVCGVDSASCGVEELNPGLKAAASGLKDVVRCRSTEMGRSMLLMLLLRSN